MLEAVGLSILARLKRSSMLPVMTISSFSCCTVGRTDPGKSTAGHGRLPLVPASAEYALLELLVPQLNAGIVPLMLLSATPSKAAAALTGPAGHRAAAQGSIAIKRRISSLTKPIREGLRTPGRVITS